jgi:HAMP domain-containing protein
MRLTIKISIAVILGIALIFSTYSYFSIQREREQLKKNLSREARHIGESLRFLVDELWQQRGEDVAIAFLKKANQDYKHTLVRWVWLDSDVLPEYQPRVPVDQLEGLFNEETVALLAGSPDGQDFLLTYLPLITVNGRIGAIELSESMNEMHDYVQESLRRSAIVVGVSIVSGLLFMGVLGSFWIGRPMRRLHAQAERIGTGDLTTSVNLSGTDEFAGLSATIEKMRSQLAEAREAEQLANDEKYAALEKLRHTERLATLGQLSAGIAHAPSGCMGIYLDFQLFIHQSSGVIQKPAEIGCRRQLETDDEPHMPIVEHRDKHTDVVSALETAAEVLLVLTRAEHVVVELDN